MVENIESEDEVDKPLKKGHTKELESKVKGKRKV
jgi:hypothetical protein